MDVPVHGRKTWRKRGRETGRERARALPGSAGVRRYSEVDEVVFENANLAAGRGDFSRQQRQVLENYMQRRNGPVP